MQRKIFKEDCGQDFGLWLDKTSKILYQDTLPIIKQISTGYKNIADYGGGNGILKSVVNCISIDIDKSKKPDIVDNILTHKGCYDLIIMRYIWHYLSDKQIKQLLNNINSDFLLIQFINDKFNLRIKKTISKNNEYKKYFRTKKQLKRLIKNFNIIKTIKINYKVTQDFYKNRLQINTNLNHKETILIYLCTPLKKNSISQQAIN